MVSLDDRKQAEEEFRKLREVLPQYMCVYAADASPLYANDGLLDYLGFTLDDFRADDFQLCAFHPDDLERVQSVRKQAMSRGKGWRACVEKMASTGGF
jgi:PAS domain-containing protein